MLLYFLEFFNIDRREKYFVGKKYNLTNEK